MTGSPTTTGRGRPERRREPARWSLADAQLVARYRDVLRAELEDTLSELRPAAADPGMFGMPPASRPALSERVQLVGLAERIVRALAIDPADDTPAPVAVPSRPGRRRLGQIGA